jgi:hypothetical protein
MVRTKQLLVCNPRSSISAKPSKKITKKRRKNSSNLNHNLVVKAQMLLDKLKFHPTITNDEDRSYIEMQIVRALNKINRLS